MSTNFRNVLATILLNLSNIVKFVEYFIRIFEHGGLRRVTETTLAAKIIANQINQHSSVLSQNFEIKIARRKRSNENKVSDIKTQNNPPLSSSDTDQQTQASLELQKHSKDELMSIIQRQDQKT